jgi:hypothetical protein
VGLKKNTKETAGERTIRLKTTDLAPGGYAVRISDGINTEIKQIVITN